jgi:hypothetical protein
MAGERCVDGLLLLGGVSRACNAMQWVIRGSGANTIELLLQILPTPPLPDAERADSVDDTSGAGWDQGAAAVARSRFSCARASSVDPGPICAQSRCHSYHIHPLSAAQDGFEFQIISGLAATHRQGSAAHQSLDAMCIRGVFRTLLVVQPIGSLAHDRSLNGRPISDEPPLCQCCNQTRESRWAVFCYGAAGGPISYPSYAPPASTTWTTACQTIENTRLRESPGHRQLHPRPTHNDPILVASPDMQAFAVGTLASMAPVTNPARKVTPQHPPTTENPSFPGTFFHAKGPTFLLKRVFHACWTPGVHAWRE